MIPHIRSIAFLAFLFPVLLLAQPGTDCANPFLVTSLPFVQTGMTTNGFGDDYSFSPCGSPYMEGDDFIITYTPLIDDKISVLLQNVASFTGLHILDNCPNAPVVNCIASDLQGGSGIRLLDDVLLSGGNTYYIVISTFPSPQSTDFDLSILSNGPPPAGSSCTNAQVLDPLPYFAVNVNTADFGNNYSGTGPCQTSNYLNGNEVIYTYTPKENEAITIEVSFLSDFFAGVQLMSDCPDAMPLCIGSDVNGSTAENLTIENILVEKDQTYYLVVSTFENPQTVSYDITIISQQVCAAPTEAIFSNITPNSAQVDWQGEAVFWNIELVESGMSPSGSGDFVDSPQQVFTGLQPETDYEVYIRSHCGPASVMITGVFDGPRSGGTPKGVELYVLHDIADLSSYGIGSANNGGGTDGEEFQFPAISVNGGTFLYFASDSTEFNAFFGFDPQFTDPSALINGDDAVELFFAGEVIDQFGWTNVDGTGQVWEYRDGWAHRINNQRNNNGFFRPEKWIYSGLDELEGGVTNATCDTPYPVLTYNSAATIASVWSEAFPFRTQAEPPTCGGFFVDAGGFSGNYFGNALDSITICPSNPTNVVAVSFSKFEVENDAENCLDELLIYDGENTMANIFSSPGGSMEGWCWNENATGKKGSGNLMGITLIATNPSGCMTFIFQSNADVELAGWEATVSCQPRVECDAPINLGTNQISNNFAELIWETAASNSTMTTLSWGTSGTLPDDGTQVNVMGNSYMLMGLSPSTAYDFYLFEDCGMDGSSPWAGPFTFTTLDCSPLGNTRSSPILISSLPFTESGFTGTCYTNTESELSADVFYTYTTGNCEYSLRLNTCSDVTDFDTYLYLYDDNGVLIEANDESPTGTCDKTLNGENRFSFIEVAVNPNSTYVIKLEGFGPNEGNYELTVEEGSISPIGIGWETREVTCKGEEDGIITLDLTGGASPYTVVWNTGATTEMISDLSAGTYVVNVEDSCGHTNTATIILENPDSLILQTTSFPTDPGKSNGYIIAEASGGTPPYAYVWDDGTSTSTLISLDVGEYCVRVLDALSCSATICTEVSVNTATQNLPDLEVLKLFPNPTQDQLNLILSFAENQDIELELVDVAGKVLGQKAVANVSEESFVFDVAAFAEGLYFIKIRTAKGSVVRRFLKL